MATPNPGFSVPQPTNQPAGQAAMPFVPGLTVGNNGMVECVPGCNTPDSSAGTLAPSTGIGGLKNAGVPMGTGTANFGQQSLQKNDVQGNPNATSKLPSK